MNSTPKNPIGKPRASGNLFVSTIAAIFYTIKYNWFYILLSVLAPLVIYKMGAGREIIALLFDKNDLFLNTLFLILSLGLMSATIWLIPSLSIYIIRLYQKLFGKGIPVSRADFFEYLIKLYSSGNANPMTNGYRQIPAKYLAMLPWTMVCSTLIQFSIKNDAINSSILFFLALNCAFLSSMIWIDGLREKKKAMRNWSSGFFMLAAGFIVFSLFKDWSKGDAPDPGFEPGTTGTVVLIYAAYILSMFATFYGLTKGDLWYQNLVARNIPAEIKKSLRFNNQLHALLLFVSLGSLIILTVLALRVQLPSVSSLTVLLLCLNFYMLIVDSFFTSQWVMSEKLNSTGSNHTPLGYRILIGALCAIFAGLALFNNTNDYKHTLPHLPSSKTVTLETYFENWYKAKLTNMKDTSKPMNVYMISGQGGGSRAAVYMLAVLRDIEKSRDKELYNQTFSISSISGSSAGIGQYIAQHQNDSLQNYLKNDTSGRSLEQLKLAYSYNFFNSNLLGLLFYDRIPACIKKAVYPTKSNTYACFNRNYIQEKEELRQLNNFTDSLVNNRNDSVYAFLQNNIQDLYHRNKPYSTPLVFFNTTILNKGKKGVFSPVADESLFCNNIDLLRDDYPVSFHFAEISSQSFPLLNNFSSFQQYYLGDGGIYENSGTSTTLQLYRRLKKYCNRNNYSVRFILINVINASSDCDSTAAQEPEGEDDHDTKSILSLLLDVVSKVPFDGHEGDAMASVIQEIKMNNYYAADSGIKDYAGNIQPAEQFALSRVFSRNTLNNFISQEKLDISLDAYSKVRKYWDDMDNPAPLGLSGIKRIYRVYTQYRNKADKEDIKALLSKKEIEDMIVSIPPIDLVETGNYTNEIRYFHPEDQADAEKLKVVLANITKTEFRLVYVSNKDLADKTPKGQLELWISTL
ncbi:MAG: hypothetical protein WC716_02680 [Chitinophagaceae bacterium]|jgi:hypothetical protein